MQIKVQQWMTTRGSYVHKHYGKIFGGIPKMLVLFFQFSQNIDDFRQNNLQGF